MTELKNNDIIIVHSAKYQTNYSTKYLNRKKWTEPNPNHLLSFIPGTIIDVFVKEGQVLDAGESILILEAMKMHNNVQMPFKGKIVKVNVEKGQKVPKNMLMVEIGPAK